MKAKKYLLFFLLGYCIYIAIEVTYRGYSFRLMGIAGGLSLAGIGMLKTPAAPLSAGVSDDGICGSDHGHRTVFGMFSRGCCITVCGTTVRAVFLLRWADLPVVFRDLVSALGGWDFSYGLCELLYLPRGGAPGVSKEEKRVVPKGSSL